MVQEAEKYKAEDEKQRDKVSSKNSLESYAFNMKATVEDEKLQGKINDEDKQKILDKCNEIISWLDKNQTAEKEEFEHQQKELEKVCNPIITKLYQTAGGMPGGMPGGFPGGGAPPSGGASSGPTIEEILVFSSGPVVEMSLYEVGCGLETVICEWKRAGSLAIWDVHAFTPEHGPRRLHALPFCLCEARAAGVRRVCKHSGLRGLDKARLRHRSNRAAMDTAESAERAHNPALPPPRSLCPPPAQPGYLSARIHPLSVPLPAEPEDCLAPAHPHAPSTSALALCPLPLPVPSVRARSWLCAVASLTFFTRGLRLPSCRSEGFWRPWLRTPGEKEKREEPRAADALLSGPGVTEAPGKLSQYQHPVRLFWPKSKCYDYLYQKAETLLKNFPIQATISFYEDSDSENEIEGLACENQSN
ncbi:Heat shock cognate 71 kDa protein [Microtus ochrogaster]|uniref:Heat shock cognate 71 kDa protein n=1 Tax=Microtus ochrogaster TaxID=79684 RepID=A0A8J6KQP3_MICOH|nr:Heat shock cognate 71 kDa protein [Microtus ochrogaster]